MVPVDHAILSVRDFGGKQEDYLPVHKFLDQTKFMMTEHPHRMFLHNTLGIKLCEDFFGDTIENSDGIAVATREIARRHIVQDCGCVPTLKDWYEAASKNEFRKYNKVLRRDIEYLKKVKEK